MEKFKVANHKREKDLVIKSLQQQVGLLAATRRGIIYTELLSSVLHKYTGDENVNEAHLQGQINLKYTNSLKQLKKNSDFYAFLIHRTIRHRELNIVDD